MSHVGSRIDCRLSIMGGLGNIISISRSCRWHSSACLIYFPAKLRLYLVLKTRGIAVDFSFSLMKCWRSSKLIEESALESSVSLYPLAESFSMEKPFFLTNVSRLSLLLLLFVCFLHSRWSHLVGNSRRWVADGIKTCMCNNCPVSVFFIWHLMSRVPLSSNRFPL